MLITAPRLPGSAGPFQIILAMYFLWGTLGPSTLAGLAVMVLLIPFNVLIARTVHKLQVRLLLNESGAGL